MSAGTADGLSAGVRGWVEERTIFYLVVSLQVCKNILFWVWVGKHDRLTPRSHVSHAHDLSLHVLFRSILLWFPIAAAGRRWFCAVFRTWSRKRRVSCVASSIPWLRAACMAASSRASRVLRQTVLSDETWGVKAAVWILFRRTSLADSSVVSIGRSKRTWEGACSGPHFEQRS